MHAKTSVFVISVEAILYLVLYNLHDRNFNITGRVNFAAVAVAATATADDDDDANDEDDSFLRNG